MATWTDPMVATPDPDLTVGVLDAWAWPVADEVNIDLNVDVLTTWTPLFNALPWLQPMIDAPAVDLAVGILAQWLNFDLTLMTLNVDLYRIDLWNADQPQGTLSGTVYYPDGTRAAGAVVRLYNRSNNRYYIRETVADGSGQYAFATVPGGISGSYYVVALDPDGGNDLPIAAADRAAHNGTVDMRFQYPVSSTGLLWPRGDN